LPPGNPELLKKKIEFLLKNPDIRSQYAQKAYEKVKKEITIEKVINSYQKIFKECIS